jgi:hypothetical protein
LEIYIYIYWRWQQACHSHKKEAELSVMGCWVLGALPMRRFGPCPERPTSQRVWKNKTQIKMCLFTVIHRGEEKRFPEE